MNNSENVILIKGYKKTTNNNSNKLHMISASCVLKIQTSPTLELHF